jgi:hypothetical protein
VQLAPEQGELWVHVISDGDDELLDVQAVAGRLGVVPPRTTAARISTRCYRRATGHRR